jgi:hypothetical protein
LKNLDAQKNFQHAQKVLGSFCNFKAAQEDYKG